jgi:Thiolase, C-terminal domain
MARRGRAIAYNRKVNYSYFPGNSQAIYSYFPGSTNSMARRSASGRMAKGHSRSCSSADHPLALAKTNVNGGAIAIGHPLGASGEGRRTPEAFWRWTIGRYAVPM